MMQPASLEGQKGCLERSQAPLLDITGSKVGPSRHLSNSKQASLSQ